MHYYGACVDSLLGDGARIGWAIGVITQTRPDKHCQEGQVNFLEKLETEEARSFGVVLARSRGHERWPPSVLL